jgi:hypothetical protein
MLEPDKLNGLRKYSVLKSDRIVTLKSETVVAVIGNLSDTKWEKFKEIFTSLVD